jgi:ubiquinone/menaquinone biosynthesis C-methylase UbiE
MSKSRSIPPSLYHKKYYLSECEGAELRGKVSERKKIVFSVADLKPGHQVLDVGCGRGEIALESARLGCNVWGIDYSEDGILLAKNNLKKMSKTKKRGKVIFQIMNAKKLKFPDNYFDRVFLVSVVEHLYPEELTLALKEIKRVIKPGGKIIIHTSPNFLFIKPLYLIAGVFGWQKPKQHVNEQSYFSLKKNLNLFQGKKTIYFPEEASYFWQSMANSSWPSFVKAAAQAINYFYQLKIISYFAYHTALGIIFAPALMATVEGGDI